MLQGAYVIGVYILHALSCNVLDSRMADRLGMRSMKVIIFFIGAVNC